MSKTGLKKELKKIKENILDERPINTKHKIQYEIPKKKSTRQYLDDIDNIDDY
jgi:hypothetical protein